MGGEIEKIWWWWSLWIFELISSLKMIKLRTKVLSFAIWNANFIYLNYSTNKWTTTNKTNIIFFFGVEIDLRIIVQKSRKDAMGERFYLWSLKGHIHRAHRNTQYINTEIGCLEYQQLHYLLQFQGPLRKCGFTSR